MITLPDGKTNEMQRAPDINYEELKRGNPETFRCFFIFYYPKLKAAARRFVDEETAEDIVQDFFACYWEQKEAIEVSNLSAFVYKWIQNKCLNHIKHRSIADAYEARIRIAEARIDFMNSQSDMNDVFRHVSSRNLREIIEESVDKLPPKCAEAFRLCYFEEMSHKEIAEKMNISQRTVEGHIRHAVLFLRKDLGDVVFFFFMFHNIF